MGDGVMTPLIFGPIALLGGVTAALALLIAMRVHERKEREYTGETSGTVPPRWHRPPRVRVRALRGRRRDLQAPRDREAQKRAHQGRSRTHRQAQDLQDRRAYGRLVRVVYLPSDPSKTILADNTGLMNE